jgi:hypothetical protein
VSFYTADVPSDPQSVVVVA